MEKVKRQRPILELLTESWTDVVREEHYEGIIGGGTEENDKVGFFILYLSVFPDDWQHVV